MKYEEWIEYERARLEAQRATAQARLIAPEPPNENELEKLEGVEEGSRDVDWDGTAGSVYPG